MVGNNGVQCLSILDLLQSLFRFLYLSPQQLRAIIGGLNQHLDLLIVELAIPRPNPRPHQLILSLPINLILLLISLLNGLWFPQFIVLS